MPYWTTVNYHHILIFAYKLTQNKEYKLHINVHYAKQLNLKQWVIFEHRPAKTKYFCFV